MKNIRNKLLSLEKKCSFYRTRRDPEFFFSRGLEVHKISFNSSISLSGMAMEEDQGGEGESTGFERVELWLRNT